jgi:prepilin-type N-terminal cleavage/methylation domain-containing protein
MTTRRAFTLIELLVVISIIAILAAIIFPVFAKAKEAATKTKALSQMRELSLAVMMYASDYDDYFVPASMRGGAGDPIVWPQLLFDYTKDTRMFLAPGAPKSEWAEDWAHRKNQSIGYSDATGIDPASTAVPGFAPAGTEGFPFAANFSDAEEAASIGLFASTPQGSNKERGYVFNPYNGPDSPDGDYKKGLPLIADYNLCEGSPLSPGQLKPIYARYGADKKGNGVTPVIFADGHAKSYSAKSMNAFGKIIWRFR